MKQILLNSIILIIFLCTEGCKKETLTHMTDFEMKIYNAVNDYRASKSLPDITLQVLMIDDAQNYSGKMADGTVTYGADDIMSSLDILKTNLGGDASGAVVQYSEYENADTVVNRMVSDQVKREVIEQDFNQTAVGTAKDSKGNWYITQIFIHIP